MGLKMENVNIYGDSPIFRGGGSQKNNIYGELPKRGGLGQLARDLAKKWGGVCF